MIDYHILPEHRLILISNWGKTTVEDVLTFSRKLRGDSDFSQSYDAIVDNTQFEQAFTRDEINKLAEPRTDTSLGGGRIAIVAPGDVTYGISRMHEIISENETPHKISVFRDTASALKWLDREGLDIESIFEEMRGRTT